jgi:hypothetical protein
MLRWVGSDSVPTHEDFLTLNLSKGEDQPIFFLPPM